MAALMDPRLAGASSKQLGAVAYSGFPVRKITQKLNNNSKFNGRRLLARRKAECQLACIADPSYSIHHSFIRREWSTTPRYNIFFNLEFFLASFYLSALYQNLQTPRAFLMDFFSSLISRWRVGDCLPGRPKKAPSSCDRSTGEEAGPERV